MKRQGQKKISTRVAGHQKCAFCHPETKGGRAREKRISDRYEEALREIYRARTEGAHSPGYFVHVARAALSPAPDAATAVEPEKEQG